MANSALVVGTPLHCLVTTVETSPKDHAGDRGLLHLVPMVGNPWQTPSPPPHGGPYLVSPSPLPHTPWPHTPALGTTGAPWTGAPHGTPPHPPAIPMETLLMPDCPSGHVLGVMWRSLHPGPSRSPAPPTSPHCPASLRVHPVPSPLPPKTLGCRFCFGHFPPPPARQRGTSSPHAAPRHGGHPLTCHRPPAPTAPS